jgi:rubrerythrin
MMREEAVVYHVCQVCGFIAEGEPPDQCPICNAKKETFNKIP